jgi:hypothetical protein
MTQKIKSEHTNKGRATPAQSQPLVQTELTATGTQVMLLLEVGWQIWQNGWMGVKLVKAEGVGSVRTVRMERLRTTEFRKLFDRGLITQSKIIEYGNDTTRIFEKI